MAFDGFFTRSIVNELRQVLINGRIDKIYHPTKYELILLVHANKQKYKLFLCVEPSSIGIYLSEKNYSNPTTPSSFCMLMRKHLQNSKLIDIKQKDFERIVELDFETRDELGFKVNKKLIIELMGKHSNIILLDIASKNIIDAIKRVPLDISKSRQVFPGLAYEYPDQKNKISPTNVQMNLFDDVHSTKDLVKNIEGMSYSLAEEILYHEHPYNTLQNILQDIDNCKLSNNIYIDNDGTPVDFHSIDFAHLHNYKILSFDSPSKCIEYYYNHRLESNRIHQKARDLLKILNKLLKKSYLKQQKLLEDIENAKNCDKYQLYGELLTSNMYALKNVTTKATVLNYYTNQNIDIPLDPKLSISKNAQKYYKKYTKSKRALIEKEYQLLKNDDLIKYLENTLALIDIADSTDIIDSINDELIEQKIFRPRKQKTKITQKKSLEPFKYMTSTGYTVLVGKNNKQNDTITKNAARTDIWLHTKDIHGSHSILLTRGESVDEQTLFEAASIAAYHSQGKLSENVPVDYTFARHVKKPHGSKPGMVIFTNNKTLYVHPKLPNS